METPVRKVLLSSKAAMVYLSVLALPLFLLAVNPTPSAGVRPTPPVCVAVCLWCSEANLYNSIPWSLPNPDMDHAHGPCNMVSCPGCDETEEESQTFAHEVQMPSDRLADLASFGSTEELLRAVLEYPDQVKFNEERHAVQILGCDGLPMAHIPVNRLINVSSLLD